MVRVCALGLAILLCTARVAAEEPSSAWRIDEVARANAHVPWVRTLDVSFDGRWAVTGGPDRAAKIWDNETHKKQAGIVLPPGKG